jgi:hypothetical protein
LLRHAVGIFPIGPRMSVHVELLLHPAPRVAFGLPIFISRDAGLLHTILRSHGEWWDNASQWFVRCVREPVQLGLRVEFRHLARGRRYREVLTPRLGPAWRVVWPLDDGRDDASIRRAEGAVDLDHGWLSVADAAPVRITRDEPGALEAVSGNWFTCDGVICIDASALQVDHASDGDAFWSSLVARLIHDPVLWKQVREATGKHHLRLNGDAAGWQDESRPLRVVPIDSRFREAFTRSVIEPEPLPTAEKSGE